MRRWSSAALAFLLVAVAPLSAELKVVSKMSVRQLPGAPPGGDMMSQMMAPMFLQMFGGEKGIEIVTITHEDGRTRVEYPAGFAGLPAGSVLVMRADGDSVGFDPKAGTWWKMPDLDAMPPEAAEIMAQMKPTVTTKKTGQIETIAGHRAERSTMTMVMPIPLPPEAANAPAEILAMIPKEVRMDGDVWLASGFGKYTKAIAKAIVQGPLSQMGFDKLVEAFDGLQMKQLMRISLLPGYEMETIVLSVTEQDEPDTLFEVPAGFKEVPMPTGIGGGLAAR